MMNVLGEIAEKTARFFSSDADDFERADKLIEEEDGEYLVVTEKKRRMAIL